VIALAVLLTALLCATAGGVIVHRQERRHGRDMRQAGEYWMAAMLRQCAGEPDREDR